MSRGNPIKHAIKRVFKRCAVAFGPLAHRRGVRILTYHSVGTRNHDMNVRPDQFAEQMEWLASHATVIALDSAPDVSEGIAITFDDGYRDNLVNAAPVLQRLGLPATVFIVAGRVGGMLEHDLPDPSNALMTWDEIRQWTDAGLDIGCHAMTHRRLSSLSEEEQRVEIVESTRMLRERTALPIRAFAYPFGSAADYTETSVRLAREAGCSCAASNRYGINKPGQNRWELRRIWIDASDDLDTFQAKVKGNLDVLAILDTRAGRLARRVLNTLLPSP